MVACLEDLINYFAQPEDDIGETLPFQLLSTNLKFFVSMQNTRRSKSNFEPCAIARICFKRKASST